VEKFDFEEIKTSAVNAIEQLPDLTPVTKIDLALQYGIREDRVVESLEQLVVQDEPITKEEHTILGAKFATDLMKAREMWLRKKAYSCPVCPETYGFLYCLSCDTHYKLFDEKAPLDLIRSIFRTK